MLIALEKLGRKAELERAVGEISRAFGAGLIVSHFAIVLRESGHRSLAERLFEAAAGMASSRSDVWSSLGNLAYDRRDYDRARSCDEKVLELHPGSVEALDNLGKIFALRKEYDRALKYLERGHELQPGNASILGTLGGVEFKLGRFKDAKAHLEAGQGSARSEAASLNIYGNLGGLYIKLKDWERAADAFQEVLKLSPGDTQALQALKFIEKRRN